MRPSRRAAPARQDRVKTLITRVKEASEHAPPGVPAAETRAVDPHTREGPPMADLAYALLLVGGFALLALMLRGLDAL